MISTSHWHAKHPFAGQTTQQTVCRKISKKVKTCLLKNGTWFAMQFNLF